MKKNNQHDDNAGLYGSGDAPRVPSSLRKPGRGLAPFPAPAGAGVTRLRATPARGAMAYVDHDNRILLGVSVAQAVEALGHNMVLDETTIDQIVELGNGSKSGIKSRFTHPGLSSDGTGKFLGRFRNFCRGFSASGVPSVRADLYLSEIASKSPNGDLAGYVMGLADEDPEAFGTSAVLWIDKVWVKQDGTEIPVYEQDDDGEWHHNKKPEDSKYDYPVARAVDLAAVDVVDEPAANRDGMFSAATAFSGTPSEWSAAIFQQIDDALTFYGISPARAYEMAMKYFEARGVEGRAYELPHTADVSGVQRLAQEGLFQKEKQMEDERMTEETFDEQPDAGRAAPERPSGHEMLNRIVEAVEARVQDKLDEQDSDTAAVLGTIVAQLEEIGAQVEQLGERLDAVEVAQAALEGEPVRTRAVPSAIGELAQRLSAAVPANLATPTAVPQYETPRENARGKRGYDALENLPEDPAQAAIVWQNLRKRS